MFKIECGGVANEAHNRFLHTIPCQPRFIVRQANHYGYGIFLIYVHSLLVKKPLPPKPIAIKKPVVADDTKSVFGKAPSPQKKTKQAFSDEDAESTEPSALRQIVQTVLRRMESIFGVEE